MNREEVATLSSTTALAGEVRADSAEQVLPDVRRPKRSEVVKAIRDEAKANGLDCSRSRAETLYMMLQLAVARVRREGPGSYYQLTGADLSERHELLETVMPDDVAEPRRGSAHDLINRHFIQGDEFAVVHTRVGANLCCVVIATHNI